MLVLDVPDDVALERMNSRGRVDDTPELSRQRLTLYHQESELVQSYFSRHVKKVNRTLKPQEAWLEIQRALAP